LTAGRAYGGLRRVDRRENNMVFKNSVSAVAAGVAAVAVAVSALGPAGIASAYQTVGPYHGCVLRTVNGYYLTAVDGGGRATDVIHTDAERIGSWERFTLEDAGDGTQRIEPYFLRTTNGHYLTVVGGGGRITDAMHSDAVDAFSLSFDAQQPLVFLFVGQGDGWYAIQTVGRHFLTAVGGGGRVTDTVHTDATRVGAWEKFQPSCNDAVLADDTVLNLSGTWTDGSSATAAITAAFTSLTVDMSEFDRPKAHGSIVDSSTITVTFPDDQTYTGTLEPPNTIVWPDGSTWTKV
jgi:hypothetical protein